MRKLGDPNEFARRHYEAGADEIIYMDVVASLYERNSLLDIVERTTRDVFVPITVGGGIRSQQDVREALRAGADKVAVNTAAVRRPELITEISRRFGSQCMVLSIEAKRRPSGDGWWAFTDNGREHTRLDVVEWARRGVASGAGEILLTSVDREGTRKGFDVDLTRAVSEAVTVPVIASGGFGKPEHLVEVVRAGKAGRRCRCRRTALWTPRRVRYPGRGAGCGYPGTNAMSGRKVVIADYGVGNLLSVRRAVDRCGGEAKVTGSASEINGADRLVLPGVGAFDDCVAALRRAGLTEPVLSFIESGRPMLGVCVGMQILFDHSDEFGSHEGLGLIPGVVRAIPAASADGRRHKIPHTGWTRLEVPAEASPDRWRDTMMADTVPGAAAYFVHSYTAHPADPAASSGRRPLRRPPRRRRCREGQHDRDAVPSGEKWSCRATDVQAVLGTIALFGEHMTRQVKDDRALLDLMMADLKASARWFQPTNYWATYEKRFLREISENGLSNFRTRDDLVFRSFGAVDFVNPIARIGISRSRVFRNWLRWVPGIETFATHLDEFLNRYIYCIDTLDLDSYTHLGYHFARYCTSNTHARPLEDFSMSLVGNPKGVVEIDGNLYTRQMIQYYLQYVDISRHLDFGEVEVYAELGCGSGRQVEICATLHPETTYLLFDIPPQLYVAEQYLSEVFPERVVSYRETRNRSDLSNLEASRIYILGSHKMPLLKHTRIDLFWNSASFHEMEPDIVKNYLDYVNKSAEWIYLSEDLGGVKKAQKPGEHGVIRTTTFDDYVSSLPSHDLIEKRQSLRINGKPLRDTAMIFRLK